VAIVSDYLVHGNKKAITVNNMATPDGWLLEVRVPRSAALSDRKAILKWIQAYREAIREKHPLWQVSFRQNGADRYYLSIVPKNSVTELTDAAYSSACGLWNDMVRYGSER
jgi:hypothetical protein